MTERPQAFFLPLDQTDLIDLETKKPEKDPTDLQEALRKNRPGLYEVDDGIFFNQFIFRLHRRG